MTQSVLAMSRQELLSLPVTVDVATAGRAFGVGRDKAYAMARRGQFPVPILRLGRRYRVTRASLLVTLGVADAQTKA